MSEKLDIYKQEYSKDFKPLIEVKNLTQIYNNKNVIFKDINFTIFKNEKVALLGGNGAGKTTTIEIIAGFRKATSGEIISHFDKELSEAKKIGIQFQDLSFPKNLRVKDIINFSINIDNLLFSKQEINDMMKIFQLEGMMKKKISKLSGGQQQRLNVFISLLNRPQLLILDEFSTGLDIAAKRNIKDFIMDYCKKNNTTLIVVSHDIDVLNEMVDRVILLKNKKIYIDLDKQNIEEKFGTLSSMLYKYID